MEAIEFRYCFTDEDKEGTEIRVVIKNKDGLHDDEVCEKFEEFMRAVGFSDQNVVNYFRN